MHSSAAQLYLAADSKKFNAGDATLAWREFGSGPVLLLVHGFPLHGFTWRKLLPELSQHYRCIAVNMAGKDDSEWGADTDFSFPAHAERLKTLIDYLEIDQYSILAHDTGATIARCLGLIDPRRVKHLALINTEMPNHRPPWIQIYQIIMRLPGVRLSFRQLLRLNIFLRSGMGFGGCFCDKRLIDGAFHEQFVAPYIQSRHKTDGLAEYLIGISWDVVDAMAERHAELAMPVLLIWGEDDPTFPIELAREMAKQIPQCIGLVPISNAKLLPHEECPEQLLPPLLDFLAKH